MCLISEERYMAVRSKFFFWTSCCTNPYNFIELSVISSLSLYVSCSVLDAMIALLLIESLLALLFLLLPSVSSVTNNRFWISSLSAGREVENQRPFVSRGCRGFFATSVFVNYVSLQDSTDTRGR
jgi:hypothetical protein